MTKKIMLAAMLMCLAGSSFAQTYMTRTGKISFNATAPKSPEKIEAVNNEVATVVDAKTGGVVFQVLVKSFKFERELMQEHFNENYMESDKFPKADFKGTITNLSEVMLGKDGTYTAKVAGKLTIHGVTKDVTVPGTVTVKGTTVSLKAKLSIVLADYNIIVASMVADKLAKEVTVTLDCNLARK